ncbi:MAG: hypothetical protein HQM06_07015 [Magnetococcales bacterium]|nr:hypothetical protein [Magnetococcales bacterium]
MDSIEINEIYTLYAKAEEYIKRTECNPEVNIIIPAINELRYAGRHLLTYLSKNGVEQLRRAKTHCQRAIYDASEAPVLYYMREFQKFQQDYAKEPIVTVWKDYLEVCIRIDQIQESNARVNTSGRQNPESMDDNRADNYATALKDYEYSQEYTQ